MKSSEIVATRYAQALFDAATEQDCVRSIQEYLAQLASEAVAPYLQPFVRLLRHPSLSRIQKEALVARLCEPIEEIKTRQLLKTFIDLLIRKERMASFKDICDLYPALVERARGVVEGYLTVAYPLDAEIKTRLMNRLAACVGKPIRYVEKEDPSLIGGFVFATRTLLLDASVRTALARLKTHLQQTSVMALPTI